MDPVDGHLAGRLGQLYHLVRGQPPAVTLGSLAMADLRAFQQARFGIKTDSIFSLIAKWATQC